MTVALVGNPNCGKTSLSNKLTGSHDSVGNYPRVTVAKKMRAVEHKGWTLEFVDLPGVYSLTSQSPEERIARDYIQDTRPDIVLNVLDAGNLQRSLFLTTQLIEMGAPRVYCLNMADEMRSKGRTINIGDFGSMLGGPVVETVAKNGEGVEALLDAVVTVAEGLPSEHPLRVPYDSHLEEAIERAEKQVADLHPGMLKETQSRWLAIKLLEGDDEVLRREAEHDELVGLVTSDREELVRTHGESVEAMFATARYGFIHGLLMEVGGEVDDMAKRMDMTRFIDSLTLHPVLGLPIFLGFLWLMFETTFTVGAIPMDWIDAGVGWISEVVSGILPAGMVHDLVVDGIIAGMGGTIIFLPNIVILFFFMAIFSETGYLSRSAFLLDRIMHSFGMHGKAFIPLVMGFGCNVPAIMATRTIESDRSRMIAILVNPYITCSARLPVFVLFAGAFFAESAGTVVFGMYMLSIVMAVLAAVLLDKFVFKGESEPFVMELPPYRMPTAAAVMHHMGEKALGFLKKVAGVILVGSIIIWFLQAFPQNIQYSQDYDSQISVLETQPESEARDTQLAVLQSKKSGEELQKSYLGRIAGGFAPIVEPIGFTWMDTVAILTGFVAKEVVVASYAVMYAQGEEADEESTGLRQALAGSMTPLVAFAFMVFILLYAPCLATIAVIKREAGGWKWAGFSVAFSLVLAYTMAFGIVTIGAIII
ncbi:Ferrous iron transport protein B [Magnetospira sp. QH-2]|nr:Ferrous iron transport protein B [Magnetospira sp. QH-2]